MPRSLQRDAREMAGSRPRCRCCTLLLAGWLAFLLWEGVTGRAVAAEPAAATTVSYPARIAGNLYRLGNPGTEAAFSFENAAYLVATSAGLILINSGLPDVPANQELLSPALIRRQMKQLGFRFADIKILLLNHAHADHFGGHADIQRETGGRVLVMAGDDEAVRTGVVSEDGVHIRYAAPCPVDEVLHDGSVVELGATRLTAHHTPGHTPGGTTWGLRVREQDRDLQVLLLDSELNYSGWMQFNDDDSGRLPARSLGNVRTLRILRGLAPDIAFGPHGSRIDGALAFHEFLDGKRVALLRELQAQIMDATDPDAWRRRLSQSRAEYTAESEKPQGRLHYPQIKLISAPNDG